MTTRVFRLFLSSPGDCAVERRRVAALVSRLNGECAGRARIDLIRWETEAYQAHDTFQAQIPQAVECDLVLTVFKWRLGTELPPSFERMENGEPYPSGTAYELLTAIEARRAGAEAPDVFVWRYGGSAPSPPIDDPAREAIEGEWRRLEAFFARFFLTPEGHFRAAFQTYSSEDDFEEQVGGLVRRWLTEKIAAGRILAWPDAIRGSPFPGLEAFGHRHAAVFFGREREIGRAVAAWRERAATGTPVLFVFGASGSGKSSLARAGLVPRLVTPGVIETVDLWRVAGLRPGDDPAGPLVALAAALLATEHDLPAAEEGRGPALPELSAESLDTPALAALLTAHPDEAAARIVGALDAISENERSREQRRRPVRADLALVVDQLDELFNPSLDEAVRDAFVAALAALARSGRVWIAATLRADLYAAMLTHPGLKALKDAGASHDLAPPGPAELAEIVRRPAEAADLVFGTDPATGEGIDERLLREAERPDMLPLVQLALARLYEGRHAETDGEGRERMVLPAEVFAALGGLTGIVDEVGERALADLDRKAIAALPRLTRSLAQLEQGGALAGTLTVTPRPLAEAAPDDPSRRLVSALVEARLLTLAEASDGGIVRLAHQRILDDWARAREIVRGSADFYRIRAEIETRRQRWEAARRADLLLPRGLPLAEAEDVARRYGEEIAPATHAYIRASRVRAGRAMMLTSGAAVVFAAVAVAALFQWSVAREQTQRAESNFGVARDAVRGVVFDIVQGLTDVSGIRVDALRRILTTAQTASDKLAGTAPDDTALMRTRGAMFENFARVYAAAGDTDAAKASADRAIDLLQTLRRLRPDDVRTEGDLSVPVVTRGNIASQLGDLRGARERFEEALALARIGARRASEDPVYRRRITSPLNRLGDLRLSLGDYAGALAAYREQVDATRREAALASEDRDLRDALWIAIFNVGFAALESGDLASARRSYDEAFAIAEGLAKTAPESAGAQRSLAVMLSNLGTLDLEEGHKERAMERYEVALAIERRLAGDDPTNGERQYTLAIALEKHGNGAYAAEDWAGALRSYAESLAIGRDLVARSPFDLRYARTVTVALANVGFAKSQMGDQAGAKAAFEERLVGARRLADRQPDVAAARRDLVVAIANRAQIGEALHEPTLDLRREAADTARPLAAIDPSYAPPLDLLHEALHNLSLVRRRANDLPGALAALEEDLGVLRRLLVLRPPDRESRRALAAGLVTVGMMKALASDGPGSAAALDEGVGTYRSLVEAGDAAALSAMEAAIETAGNMAFLLDDRARTGRFRRELVAVRRERVARDGSAHSRQALAVALVKLAPYEAAPLPMLREAADLLVAVPEDERTDTARAALVEAQGLLARFGGDMAR